MTQQLTVDIAQGRLVGESVDGARQWLGIPYATVERFDLPGAAPSWQGVRQASAKSPACPQTFGKKAMSKAPGFSEDCLALNIWAPTEPSETPRPVFFWIHGGAFIVGSADPYGGADLAQSGDMIVVAINYRLGVIGFVNFGEALGIPSIPSNIGLRDQIAALKWVRDNIAAFGGDPDRVTIAGESAGSMAVSLLMHSREAQPLYRGAIMQSGALTLIDSREESVKRARRYAEILDLDQGSLEKLRTLNVDTLLKAQTEVDREYPGGIPAAPWYDDDLLPASLEDAMAAPAHPVPLIAGHTRDEARLFEILPADMLPTKRDRLDRIIRSRLPADEAEALLALYPRNRKGRTALGTDLAFAMPTRQFAYHHGARNPTWFYRFDAANPLFGAFHGIDLSYLFSLTGLRLALVRGGGLTGKRLALAERLRAHWIHFVHHGRPGDGWPQFEPDAQKILLFDKGTSDRVANNPDGARFAAWSGQPIPAREASSPLNE